MKKLLFFLMLLPMLASAQTVSDVQNSGCLSRTRGYEGEEEPNPTIILTKEGSILSVELQNLISNCVTSDFVVKSNISESSEGSPCSLSINVNPVTGLLVANCLCPFNVSFTIRDLEPNSFYLDCWWYKGFVELTEGEPLEMEYKAENANIGDMSFRLLKVMHKAMLTNWTTEERELRIPSEVGYEGDTYIVTSIHKDAFWNTENVTKVTIPKTIMSMDFDNDNTIYTNPFCECKSLEWIEVEEGCPLFSTIDGVLFAENKTMLLGYPTASPRETYTVPEGVTNIRSGAFHHNKYLRKLVIPEEVTSLGYHSFSDTKSLEELYIKGVLDSGCMDAGLFEGMSTNVAVYVLPSEMDKFKAIYQGPVYPLPEQTNNPDTPKYFPTGMTWEEIVVNPGMELEDNNACIYEIGTDTIIGDVTYKKVLKDNAFSGLCIRESGDKVWLLNKEYPTEILLYNFDWDSNQEIVTEYLKEQGEEDYEVPQETTPVGDCQTIEIEGKTYQYIMKRLSGTLIRGIGKVAELNRYPCLLSYREPEAILPGLNYLKVHWIKRNGVEIFRSESAKEWTEETKDDIAYRPMIEEGKVWKSGGRFSGNPVQLVRYYYFDGDTIIDGKTCKQMMCQRYVNPTHPDYAIMTQIPSLIKIGAWYEEDKKVYFYNNNQFTMMYDFSLDANDTLKVQDYNPPYVIGPKQTGGIKGFKGIYRDVMWCGVGGNNSFCTTWLEGVGGIDGPMTNVYYGYENHPQFLMSCTVGDEVIYLNDEYEDGATPETIGARKKRFDFTHTTKIKPKAPMAGASEETDEAEASGIESLYGEYTNLQLGINLDPLDDTYQVRITNESGTVVYEKAVNAGSIVGLSIDISAYTKGRYTVTMENSRETFIGEFETQTTGIEAIINNKEARRNSIYNLQGQRLNSLQKGLNIVNGQKVYAK